MKKLLLLLALLLLPPAAHAAGQGESVYERVMRTGTIRCGYFSWYPAIIKDAATGEFRGIVYDYMNAAGKSLNLKVEWAEEIGLGDYPAALESGRIDAMCAGIWPTAERARVTDFLTPTYYLPLYAYARADDTRFDADLSILDDDRYSIVVLEGGATSTIRRQMFPQSKAVELPQLTSPAELFVSLAQGKADVAIYDPFTYQDFMAHNPGKLKRISDIPVKVFPNATAVRRGEDEFRRMLDHATRDLLLSGAIDRIIDKHEKYKGALFRVAKPYEVQP